jgi:hypothetical protein
MANTKGGGQSVARSYETLPQNRAGFFERRFGGADHGS